MSTSNRENRGLAEAYLDFATWFLRTGSHEFAARNADFRRRNEVALEELLSAAQNGPEQVKRSLARNLDVFSDVELPQPHPSQWADDEVRRVMLSGGDAAWILLRELVDRAPDDELLLEFLGAGPFEYWARSQPTAEQLGNLEIAIRDDEKFQRVARAAWNVSPDVERVIAGRSGHAPISDDDL